MRKYDVLFIVLQKHLMKSLKPRCKKYDSRYPACPKLVEVVMGQALHQGAVFHLSVAAFLVQLE
jgi:hypothetical protein